MNYQPRLEDIQFILEKVLHVPQRVAELPAYAEVDADLINQVLDEAGKFVAHEIAPLNRVGDEVGVEEVDEEGAGTGVGDGVAARAG
jgi:hypothetical protein